MIHTYKFNDHDVFYYFQLNVYLSWFNSEQTKTKYYQTMPRPLLIEKLQLLAQMKLQNGQQVLLAFL